MNVIRIDESKMRDFQPGCKVQFVHSDNMTFAHWSVKSGASIPGHSHPHEQVVNVIEGEFDLVLGDEKRRLGSGDVVIIPPNVPHSGTPVTDCRIIDVFYPIREDYR